MEFTNRRQLDEEWDLLDILTLISFIAQVQNMEEDGREKEYIHQVIKAISDEIEKLHKENDIIMNKLDNILEKLKEENRYGIK